jgi:hypothetical protein
LLHEILEEMLEMFATTVQVELNAMLHVCESGLQDIRIFLGLVPKESLCTFRNMFYVYVRTLTPVLSNISYSPNLPSVASKCDAPVHIYKPEGNGRLLEEGK